MQSAMNAAGPPLVPAYPDYSEIRTLNANLNAPSIQGVRTTRPVSETSVLIPVLGSVEVRQLAGRPGIQRSVLATRATQGTHSDSARGSQQVCTASFIILYRY